MDAPRLPVITISADLDGSVFMVPTGSTNGPTAPATYAPGRPHVPTVETLHFTHPAPPSALPLRFPECPRVLFRGIQDTSPRHSGGRWRTLSVGIVMSLPPLIAAPQLPERRLRPRTKPPMVGQALIRHEAPRKPVPDALRHEILGEGHVFFQRRGQGFDHLDAAGEVGPGGSDEDSIFPFRPVVHSAI